MKNARNLSQSAIVIASLLLTAAVRADQPDKYSNPHEPFTAYGMQVRMSIINPINNADQATLIPTVFQEIAQCRLTSTLSVEAYGSEWGGPSYQANESRRYVGRGFLGSETFVNPCSDVIPANAMGVVARFTVTSAAGDGEVHIDPTNASSSNAATVLKFHKGQTLMFEAGVMFARDGSFDVATWYAGADVQIDVLGYLIADPAPTAGPQGPQGDKGDTGAAGPQGAKGDTGASGPKGDKGDKGDVGIAGPQGPQGAQGPQGLTGATGPAGPQGIAGLQGPLGPMGPMGPMGPQGPQGNPGRDGVNGVTAIKGSACYPPGNNANNVLSVLDTSVTANSIVILNYTDANSNGQAQALVSQGAGHFETTGAPNTCFQYVVINTVTP